MEQWEFIYDNNDGTFKNSRKAQPSLINPMMGQVVYQFGKFYFVYQINLIGKQLKLREC